MIKDKEEMDFLDILVQLDDLRIDDVRLHFEQTAPASLTRMSHAETIDKGHARIEVRQCPTNVAIIRHAALNMIRQTPMKRMSVKRMRKAADWDDSLLTEVLAQVF